MNPEHKGRPKSSSLSLAYCCNLIVTFDDSGASKQGAHTNLCSAMFTRSVSTAEILLNFEKLEDFFSVFRWGGLGGMSTAFTVLSGGRITFGA